MKTSTILIVACVVAVGGGAAYFLLRKKPATGSGAQVPPPLAVAKQTNWASQVGSVIGNKDVQAVAQKIWGYLD